MINIANRELPKQLDHIADEDLERVAGGRNPFVRTVENIVAAAEKIVGAVVRAF